jgi:hypothetical protein
MNIAIRLLSKAEPGLVKDSRAFLDRQCAGFACSDRSQGRATVIMFSIERRPSRREM